MSSTQSLWKATNTIVFAIKGLIILRSTILRMLHLFQIGMCSTLSLVQYARSEIVSGKHKDENSCPKMWLESKMIGWKDTILICAVSNGSSWTWPLTNWLFLVLAHWVARPYAIQVSWIWAQKYNIVVLKTMGFIFHLEFFTRPFIIQLLVMPWSLASSSLVGK